MATKPNSIGMLFTGPLAAAVRAGKKTITYRPADQQHIYGDVGDILYIKEGTRYIEFRGATLVEYRGDGMMKRAPASLPGGKVYRSESAKPCQIGSGADMVTIWPWRSPLIMQRDLAATRMRITEKELVDLRDASMDDAYADGLSLNSKSGWTNGDGEWFGNIDHSPAYAVVAALQRLYPDHMPGTFVRFRFEVIE